MKPDTIVKLRDAFTMASDALQEELEGMAPAEVKESKWNPEKIAWVDAQGTKGPFQKASAEGTSQSPDFAVLVEDLKAHRGKLQRSGYFYWLFDKTPTTVGRKKKS